MSIAPAPDFIDIDRTFHTIDGTKPINADEVEVWSRYTGRTTWPDVLKYKRIVVLAEANSGKTEEFRNQVAKLNAVGGYAFFAAIEVLGRRPLDVALGREQLARFEAWKTDTAPGYFFLDSLDEARLNDISLDVALNQLALALGPAYDRATLILSSRGTDWDGDDDLRRINEAMPVESRVPEDVEEDPDEALISPLRKEEKSQKPQRNPKPNAITVVAMARLSNDQRHIFLKARGFSDITGFDTALFNHGLRPMAARPGDLAMLLAYWEEHGQFGTLRQMMEYNVEERLTEREERADASMLTKREAREGAERLAAALTLCKKLTIRTKHTGPIADDAIDPKAVLTQWTSKKIKALLRRGLFVPSTYGRARFHHRSAVEYLAAAWFERLLGELQSPARAILDIYISKGFDAPTIPSSLRASAAWLAPRFLELLEQILVLDPLILIAFGDPATLPTKDRARLLTHYAQKDAAGAVSDLLIDSQALWMFSDPTLSPAVHTAWEQNTNADFRLELLRLIEQGRLSTCSDLARHEALNVKAPSVNRIVAARALAAIGDSMGQQRLAKALLRNAKRYGPRLTPDLAVTVFPQALSVDQLLTIIADSPPAQRFQVEGFGYSLDRLFEVCRSAGEREKLLAGLALLGSQPPLEQFSRTSIPQAVLLDRLAPILRLAIPASDIDGISDALIVKSLPNVTPVTRPIMTPL